MKSFIALLFFAFFTFLFSGKLYADENFDISAKTIYSVDSNSKTKVIQDISILNKKEFIFSPNYNISFGFTDLENIQVTNTSGAIPFDVEKKEEGILLKINFNNPPKGINTVNKFSVSFETNAIAEKKGDVFEIDIPSISDPDSFKDYLIEIKPPADLSYPSVIKPFLPGKKDLIFTKDETNGNGIVLIFGDSQFFKFNLTYNIANPNLFPITTEIALPPDTNYQKVFIESLSIEPNSVKVDADGNWLAQYTLLPREKKVIKAKIFVQTVTIPQKQDLTTAESELYKNHLKYWEANDREVKEVVGSLDTPEKIYDYVLNKLSYDYSKLSVGNERLGGKASLENPSSAVCLEFADLFVTLARSAGIPARTVEGYAYTKNSKLRPLSLVEDVLHAWAQYYDFEKKTWIMVDPTWGDTTNGIDYFNTFDLDHVAFVIKGEDSSYPIPAGGYKFEEHSRDIEVSFASMDEVKIKKSYVIGNTFPKFSLGGIPISGFVKIKNTGNTLVSGKKVLVTDTETGEIKEFEINNLPPFGTEEFLVEFETPFLTNKTYDIKIQFDKLEKIESVKVSFIPDLNLILIGGGIFVASTIISVAAVKTGRVYLQRRKRKNNIRR